MMLTELFDQYFQWWQTVAGQYLDFFKQQRLFLQSLGLPLEQYLESKHAMARILDETWRNLRIPSLEEIVRLGERINLLESRLVELQEQNSEPKIAEVLENTKQLREALQDKRNQGAATELAEIKEAVERIDLKLSAWAAVSGKPARKARPADR